MYPLLLALQLFTATPLQAGTQPSIPHHYVSTVGFIDASTTTLPTATLHWPTAATKLSRGFAVGHPGMDIDTNAGQPVTSAFFGTVIEVTHTGPYGNKIIVAHPSHPEQIMTLYAHLQDIYVQVGEVVYPTSVIGTVGSSGYATGSHLHFEVRIGEAQVDPLGYF